MTSRTSLQTQKEHALDFLNLVVSGEIDQAYENYINMHGVHHNVYYSSEFSSLRHGMKENHAQFPHKRLMVKTVVGEGDLVAIHSHLVMKEGDPGISVVHIFRFEEGRIVEMWDVGQAIPTDSPNRRGPF
jgi:predicted SnoaL-like aldol condensation-catalyzing enzyme